MKRLLWGWWGQRKKWLKPAINVTMVLAISSVLVALLVVPFPFGKIQLEAGEVAPQNIVAPHKITYESALLTEEARARAAQMVPDYYDPPESRIRRQQVSRSREVLEFISTIRSDAQATPERQMDYLLAIQDLDLSVDSAQQILALAPEEWQAASNEVPLALDQAMREEIKETALPAVRRRVPVLISPDLNEDVSAVATELVRDLVRPNSFFNPERTQELRQQAWDAIQVQVQTLEQGEVVLRAGDIVLEEDVEALEYLGLNQSQWEWWEIVQSLLIVLLLVTLVVGILYRLSPRVLRSRRRSALLLSLSVVTLIVGRLMVIPSDWLPYLFPLAAFVMLAAILLDLSTAMALGITFALFVGYLSNGNLMLIFYSSIGAMLGALVLGKAERLTSFLWAGLVVTICNVVVLLALWSQPLESVSWAQMGRTLFMVLLNGGLSTSLALIGYFMLGNLFGITTNLQLMELSRPTHPLLRQLLLKAPGTYHHTILVSNLAERAAEAIGADAFLIRVGAYYHDIGKIVRPYFFTENIGDEVSPHAGLDPKTSAQIIISHVKDGADLAGKYQLPDVLQDFIWQHHGAQTMHYFYRQAQAQAAPSEMVDIADFSYPGPDPQTKEAAIMMLADVCEAAVRAERPSTRQDLETLVNKLITQRVLDGALDQSDLTFRELQTVQNTFLQVLQGVHHPRIKYPPRKTESTPAALVVVPPDTSTRILDIEVEGAVVQNGKATRQNGHTDTQSEKPPLRDWSA